MTLGRLISAWRDSYVRNGPGAAGPSVPRKMVAFWLWWPTLLSVPIWAGGVILALSLGSLWAFFIGATAANVAAACYRIARDG